MVLLYNGINDCFIKQYFELADRLDQLPDSVRELGENVAESGGFGEKRQKGDQAKEVNNTTVKDQKNMAKKETLKELNTVKTKKSLTEEEEGRQSKISEVRVPPPSGFLRRSAQPQLAQPSSEGLAGKLRRVLDREARSRVQLARQFAPRVNSHLYNTLINYSAWTLNMLYL